MSNSERKELSNALKGAEIKARKRESGRSSKSLKKESEVVDIQKSLLEQLKELTGEDYVLYKPKPQNAKVAFTQIITHNVQVLVENNYLTQAEKSFLFDISGYLHFKTNLIVERDYKNSTKQEQSNEVPKAATVQYIANLIGVTRVHASRMMKNLKQKGILANAETGMCTEDGRVVSSRTWFVNPNIMYCGDKQDIDQTVQLIFRDSLKNIRGKNGQKVKLPVRLFM